ncbi:MAG: sulfite exporter TauE/SafE family protein [bacterium]
MILVALLSALIGISLGLLGGGGSILAVPVLAYGAGMPAKEAIATSLLVVGTTSLFAMLQHARAGKVEWRTGFVFSGAAMAGAYLGGFAAQWFSGTTLLLLFAAMMVVTAGAMFRGRKDRGPATERASLPIAMVILEGLVVGGATGLVGAGGGFLVVPALVLLGGMDMHRAIGTSLLVIGLKSFAAFAGHVAHVQIDIPLALLVTGAAVAGTFVGARLARSIPADRLRKGFAVFVLVMAAYVIWREAGQTLVTLMPAWAWASVAFAAIAGAIIASVARGRVAGHGGPAH